MAKTITVDGADIETAEMIWAGVQPRADQVLEHEKTLLSHPEQIGGNKQQIETNKANNRN